MYKILSLILKKNKVMNNILIIIVMCLIIYFRSIKHSYVVDDISTYKRRLDDPVKFSFKNRLKGGVPGVIRFIKERLYGGCTFGLNIEYDNVFRIALFTTACVLIYTCLGSNAVSFWAAVLFAVNPINNQIALWANARRYLINIILVLLMVKFAPCGILFYFLTPLFQMTAIFSPVLLGDPLYLLAIPLVVVIGFKEIRSKIKSRYKIIRDSDRVKHNPRRLIITVKQFGHYFFKMIFPGNCSMTYDRLYYWGITKDGNKDAYSLNLDFARGILAFIFAAVLYCTLPGIYKSYLLFVVLGTVQWCAIIPVTQDLADRYCNLPNVFMMLIVSYLAHTYLGVYAPGILLAIAVYYVCYLNVVFRMYRNIGSYWEYHRYHYPKLPAPRKYEINTMIASGDYMGAWYLVREGLRHSPREFILLQQAAVCHKAIGEFDKAREFAKLASENYYIDQEPVQAPLMQRFLDSLPKPEEKSRQVRRAEERKNGKVK